MTQRNVTVGDDFKLPAPVKVDEASLPTYISQAALTAAINAAAAARLPGVEVVVMSADAPAAFKALAGPYTLVATGANDGVVINAAIDLAAPLQSRNDTSPANAAQIGVVRLTGGRFNITDPVKMRSGVRLTGAGWLTELRAVSVTTPGMIQLNAVVDHMVMVEKMWLNGNYSSGGTSAGIYFNMTGSTNADVTKYPPSNPDSYHTLQDLYIRGFTGNVNRHGIVLFCTSTAAQRGWMMDRIQIREIGGRGVWVQSSSDGFISNVHAGTIDGDGFFIDTANVKMSNCKAFYCDGWGLNWESGFGLISGFEAQDNVKGVYLGNPDNVATGIVVDGCRDEGLWIDHDRITVTGFTIGKNASRYATMTNGIRIGSDCRDSVAIGMVTSGPTNRIVGTWHSSAFVRINGNNTLTAVG